MLLNDHIEDINGQRCLNLTTQPLSTYRSTFDVKGFSYKNIYDAKLYAIKLIQQQKISVILLPYVDESKYFIDIFNMLQGIKTLSTPFTRPLPNLPDAYTCQVCFVISHDVSLEKQSPDLFDTFSKIPNIDCQLKQDGRSIEPLALGSSLENVQDGTSVLEFNGNRLL